MPNNHSKTGIIELEEISPKVWKAKYQGNYGVYEIKMRTDGKKAHDYSCTCPSDYYPCKHISMVKEAIEHRIAENKKNNNHSDNEINVAGILKNLSQEELCDFIAVLVRNNLGLRNIIMSEFAHKVNHTSNHDAVNHTSNHEVNYTSNHTVSDTSNHRETIDYSLKIREALESVQFEYEDSGDDADYLEIDALDRWLDKAQNYADQNNPDEAVLICKACIEEYASWNEKQDSAVNDRIDVSYQERPFQILNKILSGQGADYKALFAYCRSEIVKSKYKKTGMYSGFSELFMKLSIKVDSNDFIILQDKLLQEVKDKSSWEAETILQRKIDFYRNNQQPDRAWAVIQGNLQIESFRKELAEQLIKENKLQEAKELISFGISENKNNSRNIAGWYELKLQVALKENNISNFREQ